MRNCRRCFRRPVRRRACLRRKRSADPAHRSQPTAKICCRRKRNRWSSGRKGRRAQQLLRPGRAARLSLIAWARSRLRLRRDRRPCRRQRSKLRRARRGGQASRVCSGSARSTDSRSTATMGPIPAKSRSSSRPSCPALPTMRMRGLSFRLTAVAGVRFMQTSSRDRGNTLLAF